MFDHFLHRYQEVFKNMRMAIFIPPLPISKSEDVERNKRVVDRVVRRLFGEMAGEMIPEISVCGPSKPRTEDEKIDQCEAWAKWWRVTRKEILRSMYWSFFEL